MSQSIKVLPVRSKRDLKAFIKFPWKIYQNDPAWVPPLISEEKKRLCRKKNPFFEHAEAEYFIAWRDGQPVGRITAQIDHLHNQTHNEKTGFFGFFESFDDTAVSKALMDKAASWLKERGMTHIRGPFSFSINEVSGILVDGFEHPPVIMMGHNPKYYENHLKDWGLDKAKDLYCWYYDGRSPVPESAMQIAEAVKEYPGLVVRGVDPKNIDRDVRVIFDVFNSAWSENWGFVPLTESELKQVAKDFEMILDPAIAFIAEVEGQPAGICMGLPNLNEAIRDLNGRLFPLGFMKLLYRIKRRKIKSARLIMLGVKKEFRGSILGGLSVLLYTQMHLRGVAAGYNTGELSWTLEENEKINLGIQMMGGKCYKTYRLYEQALL